MSMSLRMIPLRASARFSLPWVLSCAARQQQAKKGLPIRVSLLDAQKSPMGRIPHRRIPFVRFSRILLSTCLLHENMIALYINLLNKQTITLTNSLVVMTAVRCNRSVAWQRRNRVRDRAAICCKKEGVSWIIMISHEHFRNSFLSFSLLFCNSF